MIYGRQIKYISSDIENRLNTETNYLDYTNAIIKYNPAYFEILICRPNSNTTLVYNTQQNIFTTATSDYSTFISNSNQILTTNNIIIELGHEVWNGNTRVNFEVKTRPIKLNSVEAKRLEYVSLRLDNNNTTNFIFKIYGSNDLKQWSLIHSGKNISILRRFTASYTYFIFEIIGSGYILINRFDIQYYERFQKNLR